MLKAVSLQVHRTLHASEQAMARVPSVKRRSTQRRRASLRPDESGERSVRADDTWLRAESDGVQRPAERRGGSAPPVAPTVGVDCCGNAANA